MATPAAQIDIVCYYYDGDGNMANSVMDEIITCYSSAAYHVKTVGAYTNKRKRYSLISKKVFDEPK